MRSAPHDGLSGCDVVRPPPQRARASAKVDPLNVIKRQIHKPNMLVLLDASGSLTGVPGGKFSNSSEVGVDCDDGLKCRGRSQGICRQPSPMHVRRGLPNSTLQGRWRPMRHGSRLSPAEEHARPAAMPARGCRLHSQSVGSCMPSGHTCGPTRECPEWNRCAETDTPCSTPGRVCPDGFCAAAPNIACTDDEDCPRAPRGACVTGGTPTDGCTEDAQCPTERRCLTGERCNRNQDCPRPAVGQCQGSGQTCQRNRDCPYGRCVRQRLCQGQSNSCRFSETSCTPIENNICAAIDNLCAMPINTVTSTNRTPACPLNTDVCDPMIMKTPWACAGRPGVCVAVTGIVHERRRCGPQPRGRSSPNAL